jgi:hypothetical protein
MISLGLFVFSVGLAGAIALGWRPHGAGQPAPVGGATAGDKGNPIIGAQL